MTFFSARLTWYLQLILLRYLHHWNIYAIFFIFVYYTWISSLPYYHMLAIKSSNISKITHLFQSTSLHIWKDIRHKHQPTQGHWWLVGTDTWKFVNWWLFIRYLQLFWFYKSWNLTEKARNVRDNQLDWFSSHLKNRKQMVFFQQDSSDLQEVYSGVPQGSVLGPLLFLLFINVVSNFTTEEGVLNMYADDVIIYTSAATSDELQIKLQLCVDKQRVLMHRHQGWNVRHGLCHIYMRYLYIYELFIAFVCFVVCSLL